MKRLSVSLFAILLLSVSLSAGTHGQDSSRALLAPGNPPLTRETVNNVASLFEWLFEARMTSPQRAELDRILKNVWRSGKTADINGVMQLNELQIKIAQLDESRRAEVREALLPKILESLQAEPVDDFSRLMLSLHENGSSEPALANRAEPSAAAGRITGSWRTSSMSMLQYRNQTTGQTKRGSGTSMAYKFDANGRFEYNGYLEITTYNCTTTVFNPMTGTYRIEGSKLILKPVTNKWQQRNNCFKSQNKDTTGKMEPQVYTWEMKMENGKEMLCLTSSEGNQVCYRRE